MHSTVEGGMVYLGALIQCHVKILEIQLTLGDLFPFDFLAIKKRLFLPVKKVFF
jgi:hypothetical protein